MQQVFVTCAGHAPPDSENNSQSANLREGCKGPCEPVSLASPAITRRCATRAESWTDRDAQVQAVRMLMQDLVTTIRGDIEL